MDLYRVEVRGEVDVSAETEEDVWACLGDATLVRPGSVIHFLDIKQIRNLGPIEQQECRENLGDS